MPTSPKETREPGPASPFVGRAAELRTVLQHAGRQREEGPGIAVISGAAGVGKTAFIARVAAELPEHVVLCVQPSTDQPFALANRLIAALCERGLAERVPPCSAEDAPHAVGQRLLTALAPAAAGGSAVTVVIDDVQHADVPSSLALGFAARRLYGQQVQFVLAVRAAADSGQDPNVRRIMPARGDVLHVRLAGLTVAEIQSLGAALGVAPLRREDARLIHEHSEGNPRYVSRLLEEMRRDPHVRAGRQPPVLRSSTTSINDQIDGLPEPSRSLVRALAVLAERCPLSTAAEVARVAQPLHALEPLLAAGLAEWWPAEPTTPVCIRTPLQQEAVYQAIPLALRRVLHERVAHVLPSDRALPHRMSAAQGRPDPALADDLAAAAWRWTIEGNLGRAAQYLLWAADVTEPDPTHDQRLLLGVSLLQRSGRHEAAAVLQDRARACRPSALRSCVMGRFAMVDGDIAAAQDLLESAVAEAKRSSSAPEFGAVAALGYTWLALLYSWLGESARARAAAGRCLAVSPFGRRIDRGTELIYLSTWCELEGPVAAHRRLTGLVNLPAAPNEVDPGDTMLLIQRGHFRLLMGEPAEAVADIEAGLRTGRRAGVSEIDDWAHFWAASAHAVLGSWDRALEHATAALDIVTADNRPHLSGMLALTAYVEANLGELAAAVEHANAAAEFAEKFSLPAERMLPAMATAAIAQVKGDDPLGAVEALRPFAGTAKGWLRVYRWMWWPIYLDALIDLGRIDDAEAGLTTVAAEIADGYRVLTVPWLYLTGRVLEAGGDPAAARPAYADALDAAPGLGNREWRTRAAASLQRLERGTEAGRLTDLLTERERAIAGLIADGLTNKAVSGYLGITEKTIEAHLTRVYRKLAVKSRGELRIAMAPCARSGSPPHQNAYGNGPSRETGGRRT